MAVILKKKSLTLESLVTRLFSAVSVDNSQILSRAGELAASGYKLVIAPMSFSILVDTGKGLTVVSQTALKLEAVMLCLKGKLGPAVSQSIRNKVEELVAEAYSKMVGYQAPTPLISAKTAKPAVMSAYHDSNGNKIVAIKMLRNLTKLGLKEAKDQVEFWIEEEAKSHPAGWIAGDTHGIKVGAELVFENPKLKDSGSTFDFIKPAEDVKVDFSNFDLAKDESETFVSYWQLGTTASNPALLKDATKLHQPVRGTDALSIYHVIAIGTFVVVAARIKANNDIAIRAVIRPHHSTALAQKLQKGLLAAGLAKKKGGHYSLHLEPDSLLMVQRSIGSTLFAMDVPFLGISTSIEKLQGVGA